MLKIDHALNIGKEFPFYCEIREMLDKLLDQKYPLSLCLKSQ